MEIPFFNLFFILVLQLVTKAAFLFFVKVCFHLIFIFSFLFISITDNFFLLALGNDNDTGCYGCLDKNNHSFMVIRVCFSLYFHYSDI